MLERNRVLGGDFENAENKNDAHDNHESPRSCQRSHKSFNREWTQMDTNLQKDVLVGQQLSDIGVYSC